MSNAWKNIDLEGGGLQSVNLAMAKAQRNKKRAYLLWLLFPLGAHRLYLHSSKGAAVFWLLSLFLIISILVFGQQFVTLIAASMLFFAFYDLYWIDQQTTKLNKALRMHLYLNSDKSAAPPKDYRGRYTEDSEDILNDYAAEKDQAKVSQRTEQNNAPKSGKKVLSFAEQEALLKEMSKSRADKKQS